MKDTLYKSSLNKERLLLKDELTKRLGVSLLKLFSLVQLTFPGVPLIYYGDEAGVRGGKDPDNRRTYPWGNEDQDLLGWYKKIIGIRNKNPLLSTGDFKQFSINEDIYGYIRFLNKGVDQFGKSRGTDNFIIVMINRNPVVEYNFEFDFKQFDNINSVKNCKAIVDQFGKSRGTDNFIIVMINRNPVVEYNFEFDFKQFDNINSVKNCKAIYELFEGKKYFTSTKTLNLKIKELGFLVISNIDLNK